MEYVNLGRTGMKVSRLCLGMMSYGTPEWWEWVLPEEDARPLIQQALDLGINFFDTADIYSMGVSEEVLGRAIADMVPRDQVVIATKVYFPMGEGPNDGGLSRVHIMNAIDASLERLGMEYVDLYQIHRWDYDTPIEETLEALHDVVKAGKARYIGASSMFAWQLAKALAISDRNGWTRFVSMQNLYNAAYREEEREMIPLCLDQGLGVIPYSPLASGFLAGNRDAEGGPTKRAKVDDFGAKRYQRESDLAVVARVVELAQEHGVTPAQIALAWLLHQPGVTAPIIGATKAEHLEQAVGALEIELSEDELAGFDGLYQPHPIMGHE